MSKAGAEDVQTSSLFVEMPEHFECLILGLCSIKIEMARASGRVGIHVGTRYFDGSIVEEAIRTASMVPLLTHWWKAWPPEPQERHAYAHVRIFWRSMIQLGCQATLFVHIIDVSIEWNPKFSCINILSTHVQTRGNSGNCSSHHAARNRQYIVYHCQEILAVILVMWLVHVTVMVVRCGMIPEKSH